MQQYHLQNWTKKLFNLSRGIEIILSIICSLWLTSDCDPWTNFILTEFGWFIILTVIDYALYSMHDKQQSYQNSYIKMEAKNFEWNSFNFNRIKWNECHFDWFNKWMTQQSRNSLNEKVVCSYLPVWRPLNLFKLHQIVNNSPWIHTTSKWERFFSSQMYELKFFFFVHSPAILSAVSTASQVISFFYRIKIVPQSLDTNQ